MNGFIKEEDINEIRERNNIVEVISEYVTLKKSGRTYKALCPFHKEKTPSFVVDPVKQLYHCFGCLPKGSLVKTEEGLYPIEEIRSGQKVVTAKGKSKEVIRTLERYYKGEMIDITVRKLSDPVSLTGDHKVFAVRTKRCKYKGKETRLCQSRCKLDCPTKFYLNYKVEKIPARELSAGDYLLYPISETIRDKRTIRLSDYLTREFKRYGPSIRELPDLIEVEDDFLRLIGYWIAEGSNHRAYIRFSLGGEEEYLAFEIKRLLKRVFGLEAGIHKRCGGKMGIEVSCCNSNLANIFENLCGKGAASKTIPIELMHLPLRKQKVLIESIFKGDGHIGKGGRKSRAGRKYIATTSPVLATQIKDILLRLGFYPSINITKEKVDSQGVNHQKAYRINWTEDLKALYSDTYRDKEGTPYWLLPIRKLNKRYFEGLVYNLTVEEDHSYIPNNFAVANCDAGGNVFNFIMKIDSVDFPEAVETLADRVGYTITFEKIDTKKLSRQARLFEINNQAMLFYQRNLFETEQGLKARDYLKSRGYSADTAKRFRLGVAFSQWDGLINYLRQKGFSLEEIKDAGLAIKGDKGSFYDRFRSRIMFPIFDLRGRTVGFGGRIFDSGVLDDAPKYMNSPETSIYHKSSISYWLNEAKSEVVKQSQALVVEGYTDVISLYQSGIRNVVATCGTAFTSEHLRALSRFTNKVVLVFDADTAGKAATERGLELLGEEKVDIFVLSLPAGFDPADFVVQRGREAFLKLLQQAVALVDFCINSVVAKYDTKSSNGRIKAAAEALPIIAALSSEVAQEEYLRKLSDRLAVSYHSLYFELDKLKKPKKRRNKVFYDEQQSTNILKLDAQGKAESEILKFILHCPEYSKKLFSELDEEYFSIPEHRKLFSALREYKEKGKPQLKVASLLNALEDEDQQKLISKLMLDFIIPEEKEDYFKDILSKLKEFGFQRQINILKLKLERLNPARNPVRYDALFEELIELEAAKRDLQPRS